MSSIAAIRWLLLLHTAVAPDGECYEVKAVVVCLQVKLCDPHLSALEVRFSRWGAIQIYVYLYIYHTVFSILSLSCSRLEIYLLQKFFLTKVQTTDKPSELPLGLLNYFLDFSRFLISFFCYPRWLFRSPCVRRLRPCLSVCLSVCLSAA